MKLRLKVSVMERLMAGFEPLSRGYSTPCWVWTGAVCNKGYGMIRVDRRTRRSHIVAWEIAAGRRVKPGYTLDHLCRNTACGRPSHVEEVTRAVNTARGNRANPRSTARAQEANRRKHENM